MASLCRVNWAKGGTVLQRIPSPQESNGPVMACQRTQLHRTNLSCQHATVIHNSARRHTTCDRGGLDSRSFYASRLISQIISMGVRRKPCDCGLSWARSGTGRTCAKLPRNSAERSACAGARKRHSFQATQDATATTPERHCPAAQQARPAKQQFPWAAARKICRIQCCGAPWRVGCWRLGQGKAAPLLSRRSLRCKGRFVRKAQLSRVGVR
jgi:hypothetical protein